MSLICAEIGQNFCGDMKLAKEMILDASLGGADLVKFQLYDTDRIYAPQSKFRDRAKQAELTFEQAFELYHYGRGAHIEVFFSVFDVERVAWCEKIGVKRYKIAYSKHADADILKAVADTGKPVIISYSTLLPAGTLNGKRTPIYCVPEYPATLDMLDFNNAFLSPISWAHGFSDHTIGIDAAKVAISLGIDYLEKHYCVAYDVGVDAPWSMTQRDLMELKKWNDIVMKLLP